MELFEEKRVNKTLARESPIKKIEEETFITNGKRRH